MEHVNGISVKKTRMLCARACAFLIIIIRFCFEEVTFSNSNMHSIHDFLEQFAQRNFQNHLCRSTSSTNVATFDLLSEKKKTQTSAVSCLL